MFAIRKCGQRKTLSGQRKTLSSQRKILLGFQESVFPFGCVCFPESGFRKTTFQTFMCLFAIRKVGQWKTLSSQRKIWLGFQESIFLKNLDGKHFPEIMKNLEMSYYFLIVSNLVLKLLIAIYIYFEYLFFNFIS